MQERLNVLTYAIKSRNLLMKVLDDLDVVVGDEGEAEQYVRKFQKWTRVKTDSRGRSGMNLFAISYRDRDPVYFAAARDLATPRKGRIMADAAIAWVADKMRSLMEG